MNEGQMSKSIWGNGYNYLSVEHSRLYDSALEARDLDGSERRKGAEYWAGIAVGLLLHIAGQSESAHRRDTR